MPSDRHVQPLHPDVAEAAVIELRASNPADVRPEIDHFRPGGRAGRRDRRDGGRTVETAGVGLVAPGWITRSASPMLTGPCTLVLRHWSPTLPSIETMGPSGVSLNTPNPPSLNCVLKIRFVLIVAGSSGHRGGVGTRGERDGGRRGRNSRYRSR